jgi:hypothetical protein
MRRVENRDSGSTRRFDEEVKAITTEDTEEHGGNRVVINADPLHALTASVLPSRCGLFHLNKILDISLIHEGRAGVDERRH